MLNTLQRKGRVQAREPQKAKPLWLLASSKQREDCREVALPALPVIVGKEENMKSQLHLKNCEHFLILLQKHESVTELCMCLAIFVKSNDNLLFFPEGENITVAVVKKMYTQTDI